jgi:hypothetical protein
VRLATGAGVDGVEEPPQLVKASRSAGVIREIKNLCIPVPRSG